MSIHFRAPNPASDFGAPADIESHIDPSRAGPDVIEWGDRAPASPLLGPFARASARVRQAIEGWWRDTGVQAASLLGAGALLAGLSLVTTWIIARMPFGDIAAGIGVLEWLTNVYLLGLLGLAALAMVALRGASHARRHARLAGLGVAAALAVILLTALVTARQSGVLGTFDVERPGADLALGPGPFLALAGVLLAGVGLYWAGRPISRKIKTSVAEPPPSLGETSDLDEPSDLTVSPAPPLVYPPVDRR